MFKIEHQNIAEKYCETLKRMMDLTYIMDTKNITEWLEQLKILDGVNFKINCMMNKENGLTLLPLKRSILLDLPKCQKKKKTEN